MLNLVGSNEINDVITSVNNYLCELEKYARRLCRHHMILDLKSLNLFFFMVEKLCVLGIFT